VTSFAAAKGRYICLIYRLLNMAESPRSVEPMAQNVILGNTSPSLKRKASDSESANVFTREDRADGV
jgi:hypothetical protein